MNDEQLGIRIKTVRKQRGLTLQNLADKTGLSIAFISKAERGLTSPTFSALLEICKALEMDLAKLARFPEDNFPVIRQDERIQVATMAEGKVKYEYATQSSRKMRALWITLKPGGTTISRGHPEEEMGIVIKGKLKATIGKDIYLVEEGDTVYIEAQTPHSLTNIGKEDCLSFFTSIHPY